MPPAPAAGSIEMEVEVVLESFDLSDLLSVLLSLLLSVLSSVLLSVSVVFSSFDVFVSEAVSVAVVEGAVSVAVDSADSVVLSTIEYQYYNERLHGVIGLIPARFSRASLAIASVFSQDHAEDKVPSSRRVHRTVNTKNRMVKAVGVDVDVDFDVDHCRSRGGRRIKDEENSNPLVERYASVLKTNPPCTNGLSGARR